MNFRRTSGLVIGIAIGVFFVQEAAAAWPTGEMTIATNTAQNVVPAVVPDGTGGVLLAWFTNSHLYAQRIDPDGTMLWAANGEDLGDHTGVYTIEVVADGSGGFIYSFELARDIYVQHVDSNGVLDWGTSPVPVCTNPANQYYPKADTDGAGGVIIAWTDYRDANMVIHAQRMDAAGAPQWTADGVPLSTTTYRHIYPLVLADGSGGAFVACDLWNDSGYSDLYCQHVDATGATTWGPEGIRVSAEHTGAIPTATNDHVWNLVSDAAGGVLAIWRHTPYTNRVSIQVSRLTAAGAKVWADSVRSLTPELSSEIIAGSTTATATPDGGLVAGWSEPRDFSASGYDIFINRMDSDGDLVWSASTAGIPLCNETSNQNTLRLAVDPAGVTWATWRDARSGAWQLYSQHLDVDGTELGAPGGDPFDLNRDPWSSIPLPVPGGVFVAYSDKRNSVPDNTTNLYAMVLGGPVSAVSPVFTSDLSLSANWPNPFGASTTIGYAIGRAGYVELTVFDLRGRRVRTLIGDAVQQGPHVAVWDGRDGNGNSLAAGVYFVQLRSRGEMVSRRITLVR